MPASTTQRIPRSADARLDARIQRQTEASIAYYASHPEQIPQRLAELDQEWTIERALEANAATLALTGTTLGLLGRRRWLLVPAVVTGFLLQHALRGWCAPIALLRRMGMRSAREIEAERNALQALRGDQRRLGDTAEAGETQTKAQRARKAAP